MKSIRKEDLEEWLRCDARRRDLDREAKTFGDRCSQIEELCEAELKAIGKHSVIRHGFTLTIVPARVSVAWAEEYLRECGPEKASALKASAAATSKPGRISITPP